MISGFTAIQILNHIDSPDHNHWRNFLDFDPLQRYGGFSYEDLIVRPAADAVRTVTRPGTKVRHTADCDQHLPSNPSLPIHSTQTHALLHNRFMYLHAIPDIVFWPPKCFVFTVLGGDGRLQLCV